MNEEIKIYDKTGKSMNVSLLGFFKIENLGKEYAMYSMLSNEDENAAIMLGEVLRHSDNSIEILGIEEEEIPVVQAYYQEIANQIGGNNG